MILTESSPSIPWMQSTSPILADSPAPGGRADRGEERGWGGRRREGEGEGRGMGKWTGGWEGSEGEEKREGREMGTNMLGWVATTK